MTITESRISLDPNGDDFVLRRVAANGAVTTMALSETDVLTLAQSAPAFQLEILRRHDPGGGNYSAVAVTEIAQIALHNESLGEAILLTMIAKSGSRQTYALPKFVAEPLAERLPVFVARLNAGRPTKQ